MAPVAASGARTRASRLGLLPLLLLLLPTASALDYTVRFTVQLDDDQRGEFTVTVREKKAPRAAARFREMVNDGFFNGCTFFRVLTGYVVQWGLSGYVTMQRQWDARGTLPDEGKIAEPDWNARGTMAFITTGPHSRGTQLFINFDDNHPLDAKGGGLAPVPFARVVSGMSTLSAIYAGYRERPKASSIRARGDGYLNAEFPKLSYIVRAQQVAFVEEPFVLSKNQTGMVITLCMALGVAVCCVGLRALQRHLRELKGYKKTARDDSFRPGFEDPEDEEDEGSANTTEGKPLR